MMMTSDWVVVNDGLMAEVLGEIQKMFPSDKKSTSEVPVTLIEALMEYVGEDLGCDHSVGICACGARQMVYELELALKGEAVCPRCGGEGFDWDQETYDKAAAEILALGCSPSDGDGYIKCPTCNSSGRVPVGDLDAD